MQKKIRSAVICWMMIVSVLMTGCSFMSPQTKKDIYHRGDDHVVYRSKPGDTFASIAEKFLGDASKAWMIEDANEKLTPSKWVVVPLNIPNQGGIYTNGIQQIPILCYHKFAKTCSSQELCISSNAFDRQMRYLKENDFHVINPEQFLDFLEYRRPLPKKSVMITIDDGYRSAYTIAYPILKKYGFRATLFIYTRYVGLSADAISWKQLRELKKNGFTIGSHTISHIDLSKRWDGESGKSYEKRLHREINGSKKILDEKLDQDTYFFSYPFGRTNQTALMLTQKAGYKLAVTVKGKSNSFYSNRYLLGRNHILEYDMAALIKKLKIFNFLSLR